MGRREEGGGGREGLQQRDIGNIAHCKCKYNIMFML